MFVAVDVLVFIASRRHVTLFVLLVQHARVTWPLASLAIPLWAPVEARSLRFLPESPCSIRCTIDMCNTAQPSTLTDLRPHRRVHLVSVSCLHLWETGGPLPTHRVVMSVFAMVEVFVDFFVSW